MPDDETESGAAPGFAISEPLRGERVGMSLLAMAETCDDPLLGTDLDARYIFSNAAHASGLLGASPAAVVGRSVRDFYGRSFMEATQATAREAQRRGSRVYEHMLDGRFSRVEVWPLRAGDRAIGVLGRVRVSCPVAEGRRRAGGGAWRPVAPVEQSSIAAPGSLRGLTREGLEVLRLSGAGLRCEEVMHLLGWTAARLDEVRERVAEHLRLPAPHWVRVEGYERGLHLFDQAHWNRVVAPACVDAA